MNNIGNYAIFSVMTTAVGMYVAADHAETLDAKIPTQQSEYQVLPAVEARRNDDIVPKPDVRMLPPNKPWERKSDLRQFFDKKYRSEHRSGGPLYHRV